MGAHVCLCLEMHACVVYMSDHVTFMHVYICPSCPLDIHTIHTGERKDKSARRAARKARREAQRAQQVVVPAATEEDLQRCVCMGGGGLSVC